MAPGVVALILLGLCFEIFFFILKTERRKVSSISQAWISILRLKPALVSFSLPGRFSTPFDAAMVQVGFGFRIHVGV